MFHVSGDTIVFSVKLTCALRRRQRWALMVSLLSCADNRGETEIYCNSCLCCCRHGAASCDRTLSQRLRLSTIIWLKQPAQTSCIYLLLQLHGSAEVLLGLQEADQTGWWTHDSFPPEEAETHSHNLWCIQIFQAPVGSSLEQLMWMDAIFLPELFTTCSSLSASRATCWTCCGEAQSW